MRVWGCEPAEERLTLLPMDISDDTKRLERRTTAGESPVVPPLLSMLPQLKYHGTREIPWEAGSTTAQGYLLVVTDSAQYREGTVKSTPARGVKESLKPPASMQ